MDEPSKPALSDTLDLVLKKFGKIWIWSILLTVTATYFLRSAGAIGVMQFNLRGPMNPNGMGTDPMVWIYFGSGLLEAIATLFSLFWLFKFMVNDLLPMFYDYAVKDSSNNQDGAWMLYRAFAGILVALGSQIAAYSLSLILRLS